MTTGRIQHRVVEIPFKMFGSLTERLQAELDKQAAQGWELITVTHASAADTMRLFLKKVG